MDNLHCRLHRGEAEAYDIGVAISPVAERSSFVVADSDGIRWSNTVPFNVNHVRIGKRSDGSVMLGVADLRLNSKVFRKPDSSQPMKIFHDEHVIYESDRVLDFDIASNGSSFIVHELAAGGTTRLVVRDMELGNERHVDLGTALTPVNAYEPGYVMRYDIKGLEVVFEPAGSDALGRGDYKFIPIAGSAMFEYEVPESSFALLTSSENGYFMEYVNTEEMPRTSHLWRLARKQLGINGREEKVIWETELILENYGGDLFISNNGKWLALSSWDFAVVDTNSADVIFEFRTVGNDEDNYRRLRNVMSPDATLSDHKSLSLGFQQFIGSNLVMGWSLGRDNCSNLVGLSDEEIKECYRTQRRNDEYRWFLDVFDLEAIELESSPNQRIELFQDSVCKRTPAGFGFATNDEGVFYSPLKVGSE